jgi:hypothetical protein
MDISHLIETVPVNKDVSIDRHPGTLAAHVSKITDAHPTAKQAAVTAVQAATVLYASHGALHQNHTTLESYRPGRGRPPVAKEDWNLAVSKFTRASSAAVNRGIAAAEKAERDLEKHEANLETAIRTKITDPDVSPQLGAEIRSYLSRMSPQDRKNALLASIGNDDYSMVTALRGAPAYLSGFRQEDTGFVSNTIEHAMGRAAPDEVLQRRAVGELRHALRVSREQLSSKYADALKIAKPLTGKNTFTVEA